MQPGAADLSFRLRKGDGGPGSLLLQGWAVRDWDGVPYNRAPAEHTEIRWFGIPQALGLDLAHDAYVEEFPRLLGTVPR